MSAVFGFATVTKVVKLEENRYAHKVYDDDLNTSQVIILSKELPLDTKLYWEFDCRTMKTHWMLQ